MATRGKKHHKDPITPNPNPASRAKAKSRKPSPPPATSPLAKKARKAAKKAGGRKTASRKA